MSAELMSIWWIEQSRHRLDDGNHFGHYPKKLLSWIGK
jgi:hypothetical protein